jgi:hypothetical protein
MDHHADGSPQGLRPSLDGAERRCRPVMAADALTHEPAIGQEVGLSLQPVLHQALSSGRLIGEMLMGGELRQDDPCYIIDI